MKYSQGGFSVIEIIIVLIVVGLIAGVGFTVLNRNDDSNSPNQTSSNNKQGRSSAYDEAPKLKNLGLKSLDAVDVTMNALRDYKASGHKGFYIFGDKLPGTPVRTNPNFEFASLKENTELVSAIDGVVMFIQEQPESKDSEVFLGTNDDTQWIIGYDHVIDLQIKKGDKVKAGDIIGKPARQNNGLLRFEIQINHGTNDSNTKHICPTTLLDDSIKDSTIQQLSSMQAAWEKISGLDLYDVSTQNPVGCLYKEITPAQAQGQSS